MKCKVFKSWSGDAIDLEGQINNWLNDNQGIEIVNMNSYSCTQTQYTNKQTQSANTGFFEDHWEPEHDNTAYVTVIIYKERKELNLKRWKDMKKDGEYLTEDKSEV